MTYVILYTFTSNLVTLFIYFQVLRLGCIARTVIPHRTMEDTVFEGYFYPKGGSLKQGLGLVGC
jgi:hypothetical protein